MRGEGGVSENESRGIDDGTENLNSRIKESKIRSSFFVKTIIKKFERKKSS